MAIHYVKPNPTVHNLVLFGIVSDRNDAYYFALEMAFMVITLEALD